MPGLTVSRFNPVCKKAHTNSHEHLMLHIPWILQLKNFVCFIHSKSIWTDGRPAYTTNAQITTWYWKPYVHNRIGYLSWRFILGLIILVTIIMRVLLIGSCSNITGTREEIHLFDHRLAALHGIVNSRGICATKIIVAAEKVSGAQEREFTAGMVLHD